MLRVVSKNKDLNFLPSLVPCGVFFMCFWNLYGLVRHVLIIIGLHNHMLCRFQRTIVYLRMVSCLPKLFMDNIVLFILILNFDKRKPL